MQKEKSKIAEYFKSALRIFQAENVDYEVIIENKESSNTLCWSIEAIFLHGLKGATNNNSQTGKSFWSLLKPYLHKSNVDQIKSFKQINSDVGRCRAWLRMSINEMSLEGYMSSILSDPTALNKHYLTSAFLLDGEATAIMMNCITSLSKYHFNLSCNSTVLNKWNLPPLQLAALISSANLKWPEPKKQRDAAGSSNHLSSPCSASIASWGSRYSTPNRPGTPNNGRTNSIIYEPVTAAEDDNDDDGGGSATVATTAATAIDSTYNTGGTGTDVITDTRVVTTKSSNVTIIIDKVAEDVDGTRVVNVTPVTSDSTADSVTGMSIGSSSIVGSNFTTSVSNENTTSNVGNNVGNKLGNTNFSTSTSLNSFNRKMKGGNDITSHTNPFLDDDDDGDGGGYDNDNSRGGGGGQATHKATTTTTTTTTATTNITTDISTFNASTTSVTNSTINVITTTITTTPFTTTTTATTTNINTTTTSITITNSTNPNLLSALTLNRAEVEDIKYRHDDVSVSETSSPDFRDARHDFYRTVYGLTSLDSDGSGGSGGRCGSGVRGVVVVKGGKSVVNGVTGGCTTSGGGGGGLNSKNNMGSDSSDGSGGGGSGGGGGGGASSIGGGGQSRKGESDLRANQPPIQPVSTMLNIVASRHVGGTDQGLNHESSSGSGSGGFISSKIVPDKRSEELRFKYIIQNNLDNLPLNFDQQQQQHQQHQQQQPSKPPPSQQIDGGKLNDGGSGGSGGGGGGGELLGSGSQQQQQQDEESFQELLKHYNNTNRLSSIPKSETVDDIIGRMVAKTTEDAKKVERRKTTFSSEEEEYTKIRNEKGLSSQNYQCKTCFAPIGMFFGKERSCSFDGSYYCTDCLDRSEAYIPHKIIYNWDFRYYKVSNRNYEYLMSKKDTLLINIHELNPNLYEHVPALNDCKTARLKLRSLKSYLQTCRAELVKELQGILNDHNHLFQEVHLYSLEDLTLVPSGTLLKSLNKGIAFAINHVHSCPLCSQKGFYCEICRANKIIYPFEVDNTIRCSTCKALYHSTCKTNLVPCPKCQRLATRNYTTPPTSDQSTNQNASSCLSDVQQNINYTFSNSNRVKN